MEKIGKFFVRAIILIFLSKHHEISDWGFSINIVVKRQRLELSEK